MANPADMKPAPMLSWRDQLGLAALLFVVALGAAQAFYFRAELPEQVASHFDDSGRPNGYMSRDGFVLFQCTMLAMMATIFGLGGWLVAITPVGLINLPNKDYWLAPERRAASMTWLTGWMRWFGAVTLAWMLVVFQFAAQASLGDGRLDSTRFWTAVGIYLVALGFAMWRLFRRFSKAPRAAPG